MVRALHLFPRPTSRFVSDARTVLSLTGALKKIWVRLNLALVYGFSSIEYSHYFLSRRNWAGLRPRVYTRKWQAKGIAWCRGDFFQSRSLYAPAFFQAPAR